MIIRARHDRMIDISVTCQYFEKQCVSYTYFVVVRLSSFTNLRRFKTISIAVFIAYYY